MARVKFYSGTKNALSTHQKEHGAIYITSDTKECFVDIGDTRVKLGDSGGSGEGGGGGGVEYQFSAPLIKTGTRIGLFLGDGLSVTESGQLTVDPIPTVTQTDDGLMLAADKVKVDKLFPDIMVEMTDSSSGLICRACKNTILFACPTKTAQQFVSLNTIDYTFTGTYTCSQAEADEFLKPKFYSSFGAQSNTNMGPWYNCPIFVLSSEIGYASIRPWCSYDGTKLNFSIRAYVKLSRSPANNLRSIPVAFKV